MLLGYEIDNSFLKTIDPYEIIPLIKKIKIIEVRFYLNHHIGWFYDSIFLLRHTMTEDIDIYIKKFNDRYITAPARVIITHKPLKEIRVINTMRRHVQLLQASFMNV